MKPKIRVKLLDPTTKAIISDRLTIQDIEFTQGPPEPHKGPLCIEVNLIDSSDVDKFKTYLDRLVGSLPIPERKVYGKTSKVEELAPIEELLKEVIKSCTTQADVIRYLRERNFVFLSYQHITDLQLPIEIKEAHQGYQFMVRKLKEGKSVKTDKYDPQLVFGIKLNKKTEKVQVYLYMKFHETLERPWDESDKLNLKKIKPKVFPHYMEQFERDKFREEERKMALNPELKPSKFYLRWEGYVKDANKTRKK